MHVEMLYFITYSKFSCSIATADISVYFKGVDVL